MRMVVALALVAAALGVGGAHADVGAARPWIGISIETAPQGVRVKEVLPDTPALRAGLKLGDVVLAIDGAKVLTPAELVARVQERGVGARVELAVLREPEKLTMTLALAARPDERNLLRERLVGKPAPGFDLPAVGRPGKVRLGALAGKVVVVEFWATWCGACVASAPRLSAWQDAHGAKGLTVVGISSEDEDVLMRHVAAQKPSHAIARDPDARVGDAYFVPALPTVVVLDRKGVVRFAGIGGGENLDAAEAVIESLLR